MKLQPTYLPSGSSGFLLSDVRACVDDGGTGDIDITHPRVELRLLLRTPFRVQYFLTWFILTYPYTADIVNITPLLVLFIFVSLAPRGNPEYII